MRGDEMKKGVYKAIVNGLIDLDTVYFCMKVANRVKREEDNKKIVLQDSFKIA